MSTLRSQRSLSTLVVERVALLASPQTRAMVELAQEWSWACPVLGQAPLPVEPVRLGDYLLVPVQQDTSQIPDRALRRVDSLFAAGHRPKGFVVVHEAPKLLPAPTEHRPGTMRMSVLPNQWKPALKLAGTALGVLGTGLAVVTGVVALAAAAVALAAVLVVPALLTVAAVVVDPILVAVTADGFWIEVDRWDS